MWHFMLMSYLFNDLVCFFWAGLGLSTGWADWVCAQTATNPFKIMWAVSQPATDPCIAMILSVRVASKWWLFSNETENH